MASRSFIPSGLFSPEGERTSPPDAQAIFTGQILRAEMRSNELANGRFQWALVETYAGSDGGGG